MSDQAPRELADGRREEPPMSTRGDEAGELQVTWCRLLLDGMVAAGVVRVVISPGSRSTPLVLAAAQDRRFSCYDVVDERSAGFFALGQARASGLPSLLVCTSGTAGAHYLPAVLEAEASGLPLLIATADRPYERLDCAAPQTIDQIGLFGAHVRGAFELGTAEPAPRALRAVRRRGFQAALRARWPRPGAVHINARFRRPLEPATPAGVRAATGTALAATATEIESRSLRASLPSTVADQAALERVAVAITAARRPLCVVGPAPLAQFDERQMLLELLRAAQIPTYADVASQLRLLPHVERAGIVWLDTLGAQLSCGVDAEALFFAGQEPDLVLQIGAPPVATAWEAWLERWVARGAHHVVLTEHDWPDPVSTAHEVVLGPLRSSCARTRALLEPHPAAQPTRDPESAWQERCHALERACSAAVATVIAPPAEPGEEHDDRRLEEATVARIVIEQMPDGGMLALSNSLPLRLADAFSPGVAEEWRPGAGHAIAVWSQRGVNGIDGIVSGVLGSLSVLPGATGEEAPATCLLIGDVAALHDLGGLAALRHRRAGPLAIVVLHNDGGRIFEQLPLGRLELDAATLEHWTTPHGRSFGGAAEMFGLRYDMVWQEGALRAALRRTFADGAATLIEARVERDSARRCFERLRGALCAACEDPS
jgi:2-succinyl-5-enolpyruvyl-6-hydroxy-3-cyclohexene-1-carboxylate synthase